MSCGVGRKEIKGARKACQCGRREPCLRSKPAKTMAGEAGERGVHEERTTDSKSM